MNNKEYAHAAEVYGWPSTCEELNGTQPNRDCKSRGWVVLYTLVGWWPLNNKHMWYERPTWWQVISSDENDTDGEISLQYKPLANTPLNVVVLLSGTHDIYCLTNILFHLHWGWKVISPLRLRGTKTTLGRVWGRGGIDDDWASYGPLVVPFCVRSLPHSESLIILIIPHIRSCWTSSRAKPTTN